MTQCVVQNKIDQLNSVLKRNQGQIGFYVLNRDAGLYDVRLTNRYGGTDGHISLGRSIVNQFSSASEAIEFIEKLTNGVSKCN